jgi:heptosyltransferase-2
MNGFGTKIRDANILVWLPSPMGDAILCTPALRAIRKRFKSCKISFYANSVVREVLSPCTLNDQWLQQRGKNPLAIARELRQHRFTHVILFKNSFASALAVFWAKIPSRVGYARENRGFLLTDKLYPAKLPNGKFKPISAIDSYLAIASEIGADTTNRSLRLFVDPAANDAMRAKLPELADIEGPIIVIVPGGAYGPSKCWPCERFAKTADWLIANYNATVIISVAPDRLEREIAAGICELSGNKLIDLGERPLSLGELKALFSASDLVISNDTGPRHIAIALGRKVITLFGPNDPVWTESQYENEIEIIGNVPCAPCSISECSQSRHFCMEAIDVEMVCKAAGDLLEGSPMRARITALQQFAETSTSFFVDPDYQKPLAGQGLTSIDAVISFSAAENLAKKNLASFRSRLQFEIESPTWPQPTTVFLKRYDSPPVMVQLKNWLAHRRRISCGFVESVSAGRLAAAGVRTPKTIAYGEQWSGLFEKRSFVLTEKIPDAEALERKLPECFDQKPTGDN